MLRGLRLLASMFSEVTLAWHGVWASTLPNSVDPKLRDVYLVPADISFPFFSFEYEISTGPRQSEQSPEGQTFQNKLAPASLASGIGDEGAESE